MKLFIYDQHHEKILDEMDLPENAPIRLLEQIFEWLEEKGILDNYENVVVANNYVIGYDEESNEPQILFD